MVDFKLQTQIKTKITIGSQIKIEPKCKNILVAELVASINSFTYSGVSTCTFWLTSIRRLNNNAIRIGEKNKNEFLITDLFL